MPLQYTIDKTYPATSKAGFTLRILGDGTSTEIDISIQKAPIGLSFEVGSNLPASVEVSSSPSATATLNTSTMVMSLTFSTAPTSGQVVDPIAVFLLYE